MATQEWTCAWHIGPDGMEVYDEPLTEVIDAEFTVADDETDDETDAVSPPRPVATPGLPTVDRRLADI